MIAMKKAKPISFAAKLKELLDEKGETAYKLAKGTGIPQQTLSRFLLGQSANPTLDTLLRLARFFEVSLSVFDCIDAISDRPERPHKDE